MISDDVTLRVNYAIIAEWRPSWISGFPKSFRKAPKLNEK